MTPLIKSSPRASSAEAATPVPTPTGYLHPRYAASLAEWGSPRQLPRSGAWLLVRNINGTSERDALAGYRHLFCRDWSMLAEDLAECVDLVSVTGVTDPFAAIDPSDLSRAFPDLVRPYKDNYVVDLRDPRPSRHHRAEVRKALRSVHLVVERDAPDVLEAWETLYDELRRQRSLSGLPAFSKQSFGLQLATPGCVAIRGVVDDRPASIAMWFVMGDVAHYHLGASSAEGYAVSASYALVDAAIDAFRERGMRWLNLGATAGVEADDDGGLAHFKRGWANAALKSYLCGRVADRPAYVRLSGTDRGATGGYFPAYRAALGE